MERPQIDGSPPVVTTAEQHAVRKTTMTRGAGARKVSERPSLTAPSQVNRERNMVVGLGGSRCLGGFAHEFCVVNTPWLRVTSILGMLSRTRDCARSLCLRMGAKTAQHVGFHTTVFPYVSRVPFQ